MKAIHSSFCGAAMFLALGLLAGCGGQDGPPRGTVSGKVTLDGQPLAGATVTFYPEGGRPSVGITDESGNYELAYTADKSGAAVGKHTVRITTAQISGEGVSPDKMKEKLPAKYNDQSELTVEVASGSNQNVNFDLTSK